MTILDQIKKHEALLAAGKGTPVAPEQDTPSPNLPAPTGLGHLGPSRGTFIPGQVLDTDVAKHNVIGAPERSRMFPIPSTPPVSRTVQNITNTTVQETAGVSLETNGVKNPEQTVLNLVQGSGMQITVDGAGGVHFVSLASTDGLTHGDSVWETDPAYFVWRDDFSYQTFGQSTLPFTGAFNETGWRLIRSSGSSIIGNWLGGAFPHFGVLQISNNNISNDFVQMMPNNNAQFAPAGSLFTWPLLDYAGWKMTWVFQFLRGGNGQGLLINESNTFTPQAFSLAKTSCYIGLAGVNGGASINNGFAPRPNVFLGLRYDTDPGTQFTLSSVANTSGGTTVYTGTITGGGSNLYEGRFFTVAGFNNGANNGRFRCVASSTTSLTLQNASGVSESHAATATTDAISDTAMKFEYVTNPNMQLNSGTGAVRNNTQGQVFNTGVTPSEGSWYRLDLVCAAAGVVTLTLSGGGSQLAQQQITCTTVSYGNSSGTSSEVSVDNGVLSLAPDDFFSSSNLSNMLDSFFGVGSKITISSTTPAFSGITGSQTCMGGGPNNTLGGGGAGISCFTNATSFGQTLGNLVVTGFPAFVPFVNFGNDTSASPTAQTKSLNIDFFSLVWNPALATSPPAINSGYSRYLVGS